MAHSGINPGTEISEALRPVLRTKAAALDAQSATSATASAAEFDINTLKAYVFPIVIAATSTYLLQKLIDNWVMGESQTDQRDMFAELQRIVKESDLPSREQLDLIEYERRLEPARHSMGEMRELIVKSIDQIEEAQKSLESAQEKTKCSLCRSTLSKLSQELKAGKDVVESGTRYILTAADKWEAMQTLKNAGKIQKEKAWDELTESERNMVRRLAEHHEIG